jgi:hypothetical protein
MNETYYVSDVRARDWTRVLNVALSALLAGVLAFSWAQTARLSEADARLNAVVQKAFYETCELTEGVSVNFRKALVAGEPGQLQSLLGEIALQLDRGELRPEAARTLCGVSAEEAATAARALSAIPGASENALCAGLIGRLETLSDMEKALSGSGEQGASLSGMVRCAQIENFVGQRGMQEGLR